MKRLLFILLSAAVIAGCSAVGPESSADTTEDISVQTATMTSLVTTSSTTEVNSYPTTDATTFEVRDSVNEITDNEKKALDKLNEKYGMNFTVLDRYLNWEYWGEVPEEQLVEFYLEDDDGELFQASGKEDSDVLDTDGYLFVLKKQELYDEAERYIRELMPEGKIRFVNHIGSSLPFDLPADVSYEIFRDSFGENNGYLLTNVYITEGMNMPEELNEYDPADPSLLPTPLGYRLRIAVYCIPKEDYDCLDDVIYGKADLNYEKMIPLN